MYVIISNLIIKEVSVLKESNGVCLVKFLDTGGAIRISKNRLYSSRKAAEERVPKRKRNVSKEEALLGPYAYWH